MDLSIIIINWNSVRLLQRCLASVYTNVVGLTFEVLVLDNASYDGCAELLPREFPNVRFFQNERNVGFAAGNNDAARHALGRVLVFLNADTEIVGPALQHMLACADARPTAGAIGPKLVNPDGLIQRSCLQAFPSILNHFLDSAYLRRLFPTWPLWGNGALSRELSGPVPVDGIVGACLMIRRAVFEETGRFRARYFMYGEDMDLCYTLQNAGRTNYYVGAATVIHHGGQSSTRQSDKHFSAVMMRESLRTFMRIHRGPFYAVLFQLSTAAAAACRLGLLAVALMLPIDPSRRQHLRGALAKWWRVLRWSLGANDRLGQQL